MIAASYLMLPFVLLCLGIYIGVKMGRAGGGGLYLKVVYFLALPVALRCMFEWGRFRGFPARKEDGSIIAANVVRILIRSVVVWVWVCLTCTVIVMFVLQLAR